MQAKQTTVGQKSGAAGAASPPAAKAKAVPAKALSFADVVKGQAQQPKAHAKVEEPKPTVPKHKVKAPVAAPAPNAQTPKPSGGVDNVEGKKQRARETLSNKFKNLLAKASFYGLPEGKVARESFESGVCDEGAACTIIEQAMARRSEAKPVAPAPAPSPGGALTKSAKKRLKVKAKLAVVPQAAPKKEAKAKKEPKPRLDKRTTVPAVPKKASAETSKPSTPLVSSQKGPAIGPTSDAPVEVSQPAASHEAVPVRPQVQLPSFQLPGRVNDDKLAKLQAHFPSLGLVNGASYHSHGVLAATRAIVEHLELSKIRQDYRDVSVVDIGANPFRHASRGRKNIHCQCPVITAKDQAKAAKLAERGVLEGITVCADRFEECNCAATRGAIYLSVHSLYYLSPEAILAKMVFTGSRLLVAIHHQFDDLYGAIEESRYYVAPDGKVTMDVMGNSEPYTHPSLLWLVAGRYEGDQFDLVWETKEVGLASLFVTRFSVVPHAHLDAIALPLPDALDTLLSLGPGRYRGDGALATALLKSRASSSEGWWEWMRSWVQAPPSWVEVELYGRALLFRDSQHPGQTMISVAVLHALTTRYASPHKLDNLTLAGMMGQARNLLKASGVPDTVQQAILLPTVLVAYRIVLRNGIGFRLSLARLAGPTSQYNELVREFDNPPNTQRPFLKLGLALVGSIWALLWIRKLGLLSSAWKVLRVARYAIPTNGTLVHAWPLLLVFLFRWVCSLFQGAPRVEGRKFKPTLAVCGKGQEYPPIAVDQSTGRPVAKFEVEKIGDDCMPQFGCVTVVGLRSVMPVVAASCAHNAKLALHKRLFSRSNDLGRGRWEVDLKSPAMLALAEVLGVKPLELDAWINRYPKKRRSDFFKAMDRIWRADFEELDLAASDFFIKREVYLLFYKFFTPALPHEFPSDVDGSVFKAFKPRVIAGPKDEYLLMTGPLTGAITKTLAKAWDGVRCNVLYATGYTARQLGEKYDLIVSCHGGVYQCVGVEADGECFEGSIGTEQFTYTYKVYALITDEDLERLAYQAGAKRFRFVDAAGNVIKGWYRAKRSSGAGDTSGGNTLVNEKVIEGMLLEKFQHTSAIIGGDDDLIIANANVKLPSDEVMISRAADMGFSMKIATKPLIKATFYSGRFYPSSVGTIWGPMLGRFFAKAFTTHKSCEHFADPDSGYLTWAKGVAIGLRKDVSFLPAARVVVSRLITEIREDALPWQAPHKFHNDLDGVEATQGTIAMVCQVYDCDPSDIRDLEEYLSKADLFQPLDHWLLERFVLVDCAPESHNPSVVIPPNTPWHQDYDDRQIVRTLKVPRRHRIDVTTGNILDAACRWWVWLAVRNIVQLHGNEVVDLAEPTHASAVAMVFDAMLSTLVVSASLIEETSKTVFGQVFKTVLGYPAKTVASVLYVAWEAVMYGDVFRRAGIPLSEQLKLRAPSAVMHLITAFMPWWMGVAFHAAFNLLSGPALTWLGVDVDSASARVLDLGL